LVGSEIASLVFCATTLASLPLLNLRHSHRHRQLLCQCFGDVYRKDELHWDRFWSQLRDRDRGSQDHAPVQRMSRGYFRDPQIERRLPWGGLMSKTLYRISLGSLIACFTLFAFHVSAQSPPTATEAFNLRIKCKKMSGMTTIRHR
jgi:hypothetical protein